MGVRTRAGLVGLALALCALRAAGGEGAAKTLPPASPAPEAATSMPETPFRALHPTRRSPPFVDAAPVCFPRDVDGALEASVRLRDGDLAGVRRVFARLDARPDAAADVRALRAIVRARGAASADRDPARMALARVASADARPEVRACALLERARLSMLLGRPYEAHVDRGRALRTGGSASWPRERMLTAAWLEAEERHQGGDDDKASLLWEELAQGADARLALAAGLRLVESRFPIGGPANGGAAEAWQAFQRLLEGAANARLDVEAWSVVAAELAIRAGDLPAAHHWLARAEGVWRGGLASVRKADVLVALGRAADARNTLDRVARAARDPDVRDLAALRLAQLALDADDVPLALQRAQDAARSLNPFVRSEAQLLIASADVARGRSDEALGSYVRVARLGGRSRDEAFQAGFDHALGVVTAPGTSCAAVVQLLGSRAALVARNTSELAPLLRVGDCFLQLRLPGAALDTYRIIQGRFGPDAEPALAVRIATAALAVGDVDAVRAAIDKALVPAAEGAAPTDPVVALRWRWLAYALAEREGRVKDGLATLDGLARAPELPADLRVAVERALLVRLGRPSDQAVARGALEASLALAPRLANDARGAIWLRLADVTLASGDTAAASARYAQAAALLEPGPQRDRALHHGALLAATKQERRDALAAAASEKPGTAWSRVSGLELRLQRLAEQVDGEQARLP